MWEKKIKMICSKCGSDNVSRDASACWDISTQSWELLAAYDNAYCDHCDEDCDLEEVEV